MLIKQHLQIKCKNKTALALWLMIGNNFSMDITIFPVPLLGFAAYSGTGKTTLLEKLIPLLVQQGIRLALVKHSHHDIELDQPNKDSYRLRKAGASQVVLAGTHRSICFHEHTQAHDSQLLEQLALLNTDELDLVLVEGFRDQPFAKIELHRSELNKPFLYTQDQHIIALVCDAITQHQIANQIKERNLPVFDFDALSSLTDFIVHYITKD